MEGQGKVKVRSRQSKHNLNRNYNLMGFDTVEINLVFHIFTVTPLKSLQRWIITEGLWNFLETSYQNVHM